jgi:hypothetical protein
MVEAHYAVNFGAGEVQPGRDQGYGWMRNISEVPIYLVQDWEQRSRQVAARRDDLVDYGRIETIDWRR